MHFDLKEWNPRLKLKKGGFIQPTFTFYICVNNQIKLFSGTVT
jgi:hypothetical protein